MCLGWWRETKTRPPYEYAKSPTFPRSPLRHILACRFFIRERFPCIWDGVLWDVCTCLPDIRFNISYSSISAGPGALSTRTTAVVVALCTPWTDHDHLQIDRSDPTLP